MAKTTIRRRARARPHAARRHARRRAAPRPGFNAKAPVREDDSESQAGAYGNGRGETDLAFGD